MEVRGIPDCDTNLKALDLAFTLKGSYAPTDAQTAGRTGYDILVTDVSRPPRSAINQPPPECLRLRLALERFRDLS